LKSRKRIFTTQIVAAMNRFIIIILVFFTLTIENSFSQSTDSILFTNDSVLFHQKKEFLVADSGSTKGQLLINSAKLFIGVPYAAKTLEGNSEEQLIVNLRGLDCSTFIESALSLTLVSESDNSSYSQYANVLKNIRYRNGNIDGYESRLHYFTDWIFDNQQKGIIEDVTQKIGGMPFEKEINFMSTHPGAYIQLSNDSNLVSRIAYFEKEISKRDYFYIPKDSVAAIEPRLEEGMIVAITTSIAGLDIAHVGFLVRQDERIHLLHASSDAGKVVISDKPLVDYLAGNKKQTGIMVIKVQ